MKHSRSNNSRAKKAAALVLISAALLSSACSAPNKNIAAQSSEISGLNSSIYENTHTSKLGPSGNSSEAQSSLTESPEPSAPESSEPEASFEDSEASTEESSEASQEESETTKEESETSQEESKQPEASEEEISLDPSNTVEASEASSTESSQESAPSEPNSHVHSFDNYKVTKQATCTEKGTMTAVCKCGEKNSKDISPLGHDYQITEQTRLEIIRKCTRCGDTIKENIAPAQPISISELDITVEDEHFYDGLEFRPAVKVMDHNKDVTYSCNVMYDKNAVNVGSYTLTIYMNGYYSGSKSFLYRIFPVAPVLELKDQSDTQCTVSWNNDHNTDDYVLEYDIDDKFSDPKNVTIAGSKTSYTIKKLKKDTKYYVRIRRVRGGIENGEKMNYLSHWSNTIKKGGPRIEVIDGITYVDGILIANKTYSLPSSYDPGLKSETQTAFNEMAAAAAKDGIYLFIISGYRSYWTQNYTYNYFVSERGRALADQVSARPGHSEHQTGLACDVNTTANSFAGTPEARWLEANCYKYGFIIRYPKGKEDITGYIYEPWHVRYLGKDLAKKVTDSGLCLEEYLGITSYYH